MGYLLIFRSKFIAPKGAKEITMANTTLRYDHDAFSDLFKAAHGSRPRFRLDDGSCDQWEIDNYISHLHEVIECEQDDREFLASIEEEERRWEAFMAV